MRRLIIKMVDSKSGLHVYTAKISSLFLVDVSYEEQESSSTDKQWRGATLLKVACTSSFPLLAPEHWGNNGTVVILKIQHGVWGLFWQSRSHHVTMFHSALDHSPTALPNARSKSFYEPNLDRAPAHDCHYWSSFVQCTQAMAFSPKRKVKNPISRSHGFLPGENQP